jgi:multiple sugar transport system permease protein
MGRPEGNDMIPLQGRAAWIGYGVLALAILFIVGPMAWIFLNSIKYQIAIYTGAWVFEPTLDNYVDVLFSRRSDLLANLINSLVVAAVSTIAVLVVGTLGAYALQRWYNGKLLARVLLGWLLVFHMIPVLTLVGPWYVFFQGLGLYNTLWALVLAHVTINLPMTMWIMLTFFNDVPHELHEAATIDGCGDFMTFRRIILPLVGPGLVSAGILSFVFSWNEFAVALNLTARDSATVPVAIARFAQQFEIQHAQMAASSMIAIIPALLLMAFGQRFVVRGLTIGAIK